MERVSKKHFFLFYDMATWMFLNIPLMIIIPLILILGYAILIIKDNKRASQKALIYKTEQDSKRVSSKAA